MKLELFGRKITPEFDTILKNTSWLFVDRILRMTVGFVLGVWIARYLGVQQYGLFSYAVAFVYLFNPLVTLGLDNVVVRHLVQAPTQQAVILGTAFRLKLVGGLLALPLAIGTILLLRPQQPLTLSIVAILAAASIFQAWDIIDLWFQSQVQSKYTVIARNVAFLGSSLFKLSLILLQAPLIAFAWTGLADLGLAAIALLAIYRTTGHSLWKWQWDFSLAKTLLKDSLPLMLSGFTIMIYMKIDQIMLGEMIDDQAVGVYSAATRLSEAWYFIPTAIISSVTPSIYKTRERSETEYYNYIEQILRLMNWIAVAVALPVTFLASNIIQFCYGEAYSQSSSILVVHIWAALFVFTGVATLPYFISEGLTRLTLQRTLLGAVINVILNLILIPQYLGVGAAMATVISQAVASYISHAFHPQTRKLFLIQTRSFLLRRSRTA